VPDQPDRFGNAGETVPHAVGGNQAAASSRTPNAFDIGMSFGSVNPLPPDLLSPEAIEHLREGGTLSRDDLEKLRMASFADSGIVAKLLDTVLAAGFTEIQSDAHVDGTISAPAAEGPMVGSVPILAREVLWSPQLTDVEGVAVTEPATYFEALTGNPDPMRGFFVTARRLLNIVTWIVALGVPLGLVAIGVVSGETPDTIVIMGFGGLVVGMLFRYSFPRTPFG